ncbi:MAG: transporter, substrate-specific component [Firmicutes bacterium]|nr:transporter, substrate-specific component [Bacillota bacterium]
MHNYNVKYLVKVSLLAAMATLLMFMEIPLPLLPVFLKLDISELPAIIAAFSMGPLAGILVELIKNVLHSANTQTLGIGECANFLVGTAFLVPAGYVYRKRANYLGAIIALVLGTVSMVALASVLNYFILLPLYQYALHFPLDQIVASGSAANPHVRDLKSFITFAIAPFNAIKGLVISLFTLLIYKKVLPMLREG